MILHKAYSPHWVAVLVTFATFELLLPLIQLWMWLTLIGYAFAVEGVALRRQGLGDTLTEHVDWFVQGGPDRRALVVGFALAMTFRLLSVPALVAGNPNAFLRWAPLVCLMAGFGRWAVPHLLKGGRDG